MRAIILSGLPAAGKTTVATILSRKLGMPVLAGGDVLREIATEMGYKPSGDDWWDTPEGLRFHREREDTPDFDKRVDQRMLERISQGDIIVTSTTMPWLSKEGFKVWLDAEEDTRAERMAKRDNTGVEESRKAIEDRQQDNHEIYKSMYNIDFGNDKAPFDLEINVNDMKPEQIADMIISKFNESEQKAKEIKPKTKKK